MSGIKHNTSETSR